MLSSMVKEHQSRQQIRREEQERRRKETLQSSTNLTNALVDHLNVGVAQAYLNQKRLDGEARRLEQSAAVLQKQTQHWITLVNGFCSALKQLGDVPSWTGVIHKDVSTVAATLQLAYTTTYNRTHAAPLHAGSSSSSAHLAPPLGALPSISDTPVHWAGSKEAIASATCSTKTQDTLALCEEDDEPSRERRDVLESSSSCDTVVENAASTPHLEDSTSPDQ